MIKVFVVREGAPGEKRVAATPETVKKMVAAGLQVSVESGAGAGIFVDDPAFATAGARVTTERATELQAADVVLSVVGLPIDDIAKLRPEALLIGLLAPLQNPASALALQQAKTRAIAMELIPRTTRAQEMDVLSSQASIAGYKAVLLAASRLGKYFPLLMTAAGTIPPARVVIMGAGVAGLQAVATARRLGAIVEVSDVRAAVKEQVESLGGKFIELPKVESGEGQGGYAREMSPEFLAQQREIVTRHVAQADVVITTALVPGKKAPTLLTRAMVEGMKPGSLIVDLAVSQGGNCELSQPGEEVQHHGTLILGPTNLPAETAFDASMLYARNLWALLKILVKNAELVLDTQDDIVDAALLTAAGEIRHAPTRASLEGAN
jgi:H+-translocating NAD(P) transhydrogenase subunit alpha